jgi:GNAT superfamily N-acetyltransferase
MLTTIREAGEADAPGIARIHVESWRTTYAGILPESCLAGLSFGNSEVRWKEILEHSEDRSHTYVAESPKSGIVGFSSAGQARASGNPGWELYAIYLLQSCQGSGLGRKLFARALELAAAKDSEDSAGAPVSTWCLSTNPSCRFYEKLGGEPLEKQMAEIGGVSLEETCYGWQDTYELRNRLTAEC